MAKTEQLKIISGKYRGQTLKFPQSEKTHPMGAREKLALFNMVNVENAVVLDAFAGSGALGIEALSRGAEAVTFVENNTKATAIIKENLANLDLEAKVVKMRVGEFAKQAIETRFNVIFADPPYDKIERSELVTLISLLSDDGVLALSSPKEQGILDLDGLRVSSVHTYARAQITIYKRA